MRKVTAIIERGKDGTYDVYLADYSGLPFGLLGQGRTVEETQRDLYAALDDMRRCYAEVGKYFPMCVDFEFGRAVGAD